MDAMVIGLVVVGGLLLAGLALLMLNRAWGDFPGRISPPPYSAPPRPPSPGPSRAMEQLGGEPGQPGAGASPEPPAGAPAGGMIAVRHPLVRQTIARALEQGGSPYALYFMRDGDTIYLNLDRIADPAQRQRVARTFAAINDGEGGNLSMPEMIRAVQEISRLR